MTTATGTPPADPQSAALDLIVRIAEALPGGAPALRAALQHLAGVLQLECALADLAWDDVRLAAATIVDAACTADDPVGALRIRAAAMRAGCWDCANPQGLAQALDRAATVLDVM
jgi:hypothetical protein